MYRIWTMRAAALALTTALFAAGAPAQAQESPGYQNFSDFSAELRRVVNGSDAATLRSLGESLEGREIWLVEIGARSGAPLEERPALLIVGNLQGDLVAGSQLALETVRYLLSGSEDAARVLAENTVYVVPRLNPDAAEAMFARVRQDRARNARPYDDDNDGRVDEDPAEDLNGDGFITVMRVAEAGGAYMVDPDDARLMRLADASKGEVGTHALYWEGRDSDGDGFYNEDGLGGVDLDRNFQHAYPYWEADAGYHMVSEPETRALMDFVVDHRNIAAVFTFGGSDNLVSAPDSRGALTGTKGLDLLAWADAADDDVFDVGVFRDGPGGGGFGFFFGGGDGLNLRGAQPGRDNDPSSGRRPSTTVHANDLAYFTRVSEAYREVTGIERLATSREAEGAFFQFGYFHYGVPSFSTPGWGLPEAMEAEGEAESGDDAGEQAPAAAPARGGRGGGDASGTNDAAVVSAFDAAGIDVFADWTSYTHPDLGAVEIGGFLPYAVMNPPADRLAELGRSHGAFAARLAGMLPKLRFAETEVVNHGGGVFTVTAEVVNEGYFPTALRHGVISEGAGPVTVQIQVDPETILTGDAKSATTASIAGSGGRVKHTWVIRGREGSNVEIRLISQKGGRDSATVTLR